MGQGRIPQKREFIEPSLLEHVLARVRQTHNIRICSLWHWSDSLSHPDLPELVKIAKRYALQVHVSTTGHYCACCLDDLVAAEPDCFIVGLSGWSQAVYARHQPGGKVKAVKQLLGCLSSLRAKHVIVNYHRYKDNLHEEAGARRFCRVAGLHFNAVWATQNCIEDLIDGESSDLLVVPLKEQRRIVSTSPHYTCPLIAEVLAVGIDGGVRRCNLSANIETVANLLYDSVQTALDRRDRALCNRCHESRAYQLICGLNPKIEREAARRVAGHQLRYLVERVKNKVWLRLIPKANP